MLYFFLDSIFHKVFFLNLEATFSINFDGILQNVTFTLK